MSKSLFLLNLSPAELAAIEEVTSSMIKVTEPVIYWAHGENMGDAQCTLGVATDASIVLLRQSGITPNNKRYEEILQSIIVCTVLTLCAEHAKHQIKEVMNTEEPSDDIRTENPN